jgi:hypothetical protein
MADRISVNIANPTAIDGVKKHSTTNKGDTTKPNQTKFIEDAIIVYSKLLESGMMDNMDEALEIFSQLKAKDLIEQLETLAKERNINPHEFVADAVAYKLSLFKSHAKSAKPRSSELEAKERIQKGFDYICQYNQDKPVGERIQITVNALKCITGSGYNPVDNWKKENQESWDAANKGSTRNSPEFKIDGKLLTDWLKSKKSEVVG